MPPYRARQRALAPELHVNAHAAERLHVVRLLGLDQTSLTRLQSMNTAAHVVLQRAGFDHDAGPRSGLRAMSGAQSCGQCLLAKGRRAFVFPGRRRHYELVAQCAVDGLAQLLLATRIGRHPFPELPRWAVPHVLPVLTGELRDPVVQVILVKSDDGGVHCAV